MQGIEDDLPVTIVVWQPLKKASMSSPPYTSSALQAEADGLLWEGIGIRRFKVRRPLPFLFDCANAKPFATH